MNLTRQAKLKRQYAHSVPGFAFMHDFAITPHYCIFFQNPVRFNPLPFLFGVRAAAECIQFQADRPTRALLIPRQPGGEVKTFEIEAGFVFHHANAFEQGDEVVVDSICYDSFPAIEPGADYHDTDFAALPPGQLWRFRLNLQTGAVTRELVEPRCCEFPYVHPAKAGQPHRFVYMAAGHEATGNAPLQAILKLDLETRSRQIWSAAPHGYVSEPIFVPRSPQAYRDGLPNSELVGAEDDGWLLTLVFDAEQERSDVVILDAANLEQGPIARLHLKHHVPYGLHGSFTPCCFGQG